MVKTWSNYRLQKTLFINNISWPSATEPLAEVIHLLCSVVFQMGDDMDKGEDINKTNCYSTSAGNT